MTGAGIIGLIAFVAALSLLAWPLGAFALWLGIALLLRAARLPRAR